MSAGLANTSSIDTLRIFSSSSAQERTNGSPVATVSTEPFSSTGRIR